MIIEVHHWSLSHYGHSNVSSPRRMPSRLFWQAVNTRWGAAMDAIAGSGGTFPNIKSTL